MNKVVLTEAKRFMKTVIMLPLVQTTLVMKLPMLKAEKPLKMQIPQKRQVRSTKNNRTIHYKIRFKLVLVRMVMRISKNLMIKNLPKTKLKIG